ncbi:MAG: hypothetical protein LBS11_11310 [Oscillospiraceae bacterium]|jgi:hypothetical protein|nr:hypothetical protein [Oscillospiraceae bacterium]
MSRIRFLINRALRMDWRGMLATARYLSPIARRSTVWLMIDMFRCAVRYQAGYIDYKIAQFYRLNDSQRSTQITRGISNRIVARMNDKADWHFFDNKNEFNTLFARYVRRDWFDLTDTSEFTSRALSRFLDNRGDIIAKPMDGSSGQGIMKFTPDDFADRAAFESLLRAKGLTLLEDCVKQHPAMAGMCPTSVNTMRIATLLGDKKQGVVYAYLRIGNGKVMDNVDCGGMAAPIDLETGRLSGVGADKAGRAYSAHPLTGTAIPGFEIPYFKEAVGMCLEAMRVKPRVRFVAWDVAVTPDGPVFIEGNSFPSHAIPQFAAHFPDGIGILPRFEEFIDL